MICVWRRQWAAFGLRCGSQWHPRQRPTVGAGSSRFSRRFPRPPVHHVRAPYRLSPFPVVFSHMVMSVRVVFVATWRAAFLTPRRAPKTPRCDKNRASPRVVCAYTYNGRWAGESSRKPRSPSPYSRHCGEGAATYAAPTIICAHMGINGNGMKAR